MIIYVQDQIRCQHDNAFVFLRLCSS